MNQKPLDSEPTVEWSLDGHVIPLYDVELLRWLSPWLISLVVNVLATRVNFKVLKEKQQRSWTCKGAFQIIDLQDGFYHVIFSNQEDYNLMLFKGPWKVADHYLIVQRCQPFFFYECKEAQEKMVV